MCFPWFLFGPCCFVFLSSVLFVCCFVCGRVVVICLVFVLLSSCRLSLLSGSYLSVLNGWACISCRCRLWLSFFVWSGSVFLLWVGLYPFHCWCWFDLSLLFCFGYFYCDRSSLYCLVVFFSSLFVCLIGRAAFGGSFFFFRRFLFGLSIFLFVDFFSCFACALRSFFVPFLASRCFRFFLFCWWFLLFFRSVDFPCRCPYSLWSVLVGFLRCFSLLFLLVVWLFRHFVPAGWL